MKITWLGHACFLLESGGYALVLDPYADVPGLQDVHIAAEQVLCSHEHFDHHYLEGVAVRDGGKSPFSVETMETFHDAQAGALRGKNTVHILRAEGLTVVHLGDLGHRLEERQAAALRLCDALLLPVGGTYTMDAALAAETVQQLQPRVVVPMHYRGDSFGFADIGGLEPFLEQMAAWPVQRCAGSTLELTADMPLRTVLLQPDLAV